MPLVSGRMRSEVNGVAGPCARRRRSEPITPVDVAPAVWVAPLLARWPTRVESPKSPSLTSPLRATKIFWGCTRDGEDGRERRWKRG